MSSAAHEFKQDMPPPGGYQSINYHRVPAKSYFKGFTIFGGFFAISAGSFYLYYLNMVALKRRRIEMRSATFALEPLLTAERDRQYMLQLRKNRDEEAELMKDVKGWKVGTFWGKPIYKTISDEEFVPERMEDFYAHSGNKEYYRKAFWHQWL